MMQCIITWKKRKRYSETERDRKKIKLTIQKIRQLIMCSLPNFAESHLKWQMWRGRRFTLRKAELFWGRLLEEVAKYLRTSAQSELWHIHSFIHSFMYPCMHATNIHHTLTTSLTHQQQLKILWGSDIVPAFKKLTICWKISGKKQVNWFYP